MAETVVTTFEKVALALRELELLVGAAGEGELASVIVAVQGCCNSLDQVRRAVADRVMESDVWVLDGCRSPARWIARHAGMSSGAAARICRQVRDLRLMPQARHAALEGRLSTRQVELLAQCRRMAPERFTAEIEELLVGLADAPEDLAAAVEAFRAAARPDGKEGPDGEVSAGSFSLGDSLDGRLRGSLVLGAEDGAVVAAALDRRVTRMIQRRRDGDPTLAVMSIAAMRAQALVDLCDADLRRDPGRRRAPDRHRIALTMQLDEQGNVVPVGALPAAGTCDVELFRLVRGARGEILELGRTERTWSGAQATAVVRRDRHCRFPGCDAPPAQCDIHHCQPWEHGGPTDITNGVLLCRWHHTYLHRHHWSIRLDRAQRPHTYLPDGTEHVFRGGRCAAPGGHPASMTGAAPPAASP